MLLRIRVKLKSTGFTTEVIELPIIKETPLEYKVLDDRKPFRVRKAAILVPDSKMYDLDYLIAYFTYCKLEDKDKAINLLHSHIREIVIKKKKQIDELYNQL